MDVATKLKTSTVQQPKELGSQPGAEEGKFKEVWNKFMSEYGKKPEKAREIKKELDKDDYLRIMVTQMQHQDPTKPFEADKLASEMAQVGVIKHMQEVGSALKKLADNNKPLERIAMTNLIGKKVTIDKTRFVHHKDSNEVLDFHLDRPAETVKIAIISPRGEVVAEKDLGKMEAGSNNYKWDGIKKNTLPAEDGTYFFRVDAVDKRGAPIVTNFLAETKVVGVSFEKGEPVLLVGDQDRQTKIEMKNIIKIESQAPLVPGAQLSGRAAEANQVGTKFIKKDKPKNLFSFKKGVGSQPMTESQLPPAAQAALNKKASETPVAEKKPVSKNVNRGFPHGIEKTQTPAQPNKVKNLAKMSNKPPIQKGVARE